MSDSENDLLSNPFQFQTDITVVSAKGPNINTGNMSFRNNLSSTHQLPRTFEPRYAESCCDPRIRYYRREPSPMSVASAGNARYRNFNFNNSHYRGMSSQRSVYNGRSGSPMSVRTLDSAASVRASDIAMALKHEHFNKYEMRIIKEAFNSLMKKKSRKRIEKRRNLKLFMKGSRRRSGYDSGEQASDSSLSNDDGRSIRTGFEATMSSCRSTKTDLVAEIRKTINDGNIYKDCTDNFRQNSLRIVVNGPANLNHTQASTSSMRNPLHSYHASQLKSSSSSQSLPNFQTQKERFQNGFVLPSQRFDKSVVPPSIPEIPHTQNDDTDGDYNLFSNENKQTNNDNRKRSITEEATVLPNNKRTKVVSPCKNSAEAKKATKEIANNKETENSNNFEFAKPMMPVRKFKEKLLSKSGSLPSDIVIEVPKNQQPGNKRNSKEADLDHETSNMTDITDVSLRPSFIKRKLFTQKLDVTENINQNTDNIKSPQNSIYSEIQKEKHKARKLVTNQSCLSRDIGHDESNLLDLIHKIVPANSMNVTMQSNVNKTNFNINKSIDSDKFDVTSIITANPDDDVSDTFTDEEMLKGDNNNTMKEIPNETAKNTEVNANAKVNGKIKKVEKSKMNDVNKVKKTPPKETLKKPVGHLNQNNCKVVNERTPNKDVAISSEKNGVNKNGKPKCWSTFWDLDSESDVENINPKRNQFQDSSNESIKEHVKNTSIAKGIGAIFQKPSILNASTVSAFDTTQCLNITGFKIRSHRYPIMKKCDEIKGNTIKSYFETSDRKLNDISIHMDHKKLEENLVQKTSIPNNIKTQEDSKTANTKKAKKTPQKENPNKKTKVKENNPSTEKKKKPNAPKTKNSPPKTIESKMKTPTKGETERERKGKPPKSETQNRNVSEKNKQKTPAKVQDKRKDSKTNTSEQKIPKKDQSKTLKENQAPNKKQSNTKLPKKTDHIKNNINKQKILLDSSLTNSTMENDNSKICRAIRSCRISKNSTINSSKSSLNLTMTLRPRKVDLSHSMNNSGIKFNISVKENKSKRIK